jgi:hypothetical protein
MSDSLTQLIAILRNTPNDPAVALLPQLLQAHSEMNGQPAQPAAQAQPYYGSEGGEYTPQQILERNKAWTQPGDTSYQTQLNPQEETQFRQWVAQNKVEFDPAQATPDYDMRGFWKALQSGDPRAKGAVDPNDGRLHYPDYWKTPYDLTFSKQSKFANPAVAPDWNDKNELVTPGGQVIWNDSDPNMRQLIRSTPTLSALQVKLNPVKATPAAGSK